MHATRQRTLEHRLRQTLSVEADLPTLARTLYDAIAHHIAYDFACFATTDPASGVVTWASKTRSLGVGDEEFAASEYGPPDVNKFDEIARRVPPVGVLSIDTGGDLDACRRHRDFLHPRFGFTDELRAVFSSRSASWGALGLYRGSLEPRFSAEEAQQIAPICGLVAEAIQRSLFRLHPDSRESASDLESEGPAVLIVDAADRLTHLTPAARTAIDELGGFDHGSLPASVQMVVSIIRSRAQPFSTRTQVPDGRWLSLRAAPLDGGKSNGCDVVVTIEPTPRAALSRLALAAHGLTAREEDVAVLVLQGVNTQGIADTLHLSPHTVQDHLKTVFTKLGVTSRREMTARLVLN